MTSDAPQSVGYELGELGQSLPMGVFRTTPEGVFLAANDALAEILGVAAPADLIGRSSLDFYVSAHDREEWAGIVAEKGVVYANDVRLRRADGAVIWARNSTRCVCGPDGDVLRFEGVLEDVTEEREERELWHMAFEAAPVGMSISDTTGWPLRVNPALCELLGYDRESLLEKSLLDHVHADDRPLGAERLAALGIGSGSAKPASRRLIRSDGTVISTFITASGVADADGNIRAILSQVIDVTDSMQVQAELRQSEERFRAAFEEAPLGMLITGGDDTTLQVNSALCAMVGYPRRELLGHGVAPLTHPDDREEVSRRREAVLRGEPVDYPVERRLRHRDGHYIWVRVRASSIQLPSGQTGTLSHLEDVTEQRQALDLIRAGQAENQALLDSIPDLMFRLDGQGRYTWFREGIGIGLAVDPADFMGKHYAEVFPQMADAMANCIDALPRTREPQSFEYQLEMPDGPRDYEARFVGMGDDEVLLLVRDTTEQNDARRQMERLLQSKDEFIASVSHELRNPLTTIVGIAEELSSGWGQFSETDGLEMVKLVADQGKDMADLLEDLLAAARADIGMIRVDRVEVDLMREVLGVLAVWPPDTASVTTRGTVMAMADPRRVRQVLRNLISNADRHGGPEISIQVEQRPGGAIISVCDDGAPVPEDKRELIFDPYYVASTHADSVGLGLSISRTLARLMEGDLTYDHDGQRSVFELRLPLATFSRPPRG